MKTIESPPTADPVIEMLTTGKPIPEEVRNRLRAEARRVADEIEQEFPPITAAEIIREIRQ